MKCVNCDYYKSGYLYNACALTEIECFCPLENCPLVNDDMSVNYDDPYFGGGGEDDAAR